MKSALDRATRTGERPGDGVAPSPAPPDTPRVVVGAAVLMVLSQLTFRAWALYPSWFYVDDYKLLADATGATLGPSYLLRPFDSQFMPWGRFIVWLVAHAGNVAWPVAATSILVMQLLASMACLWMLVTLFGRRVGILFPLAVYLFGSMTVPPLMWWAAALNQLPLQLVFFAATASWVRYLRTGSLRWLVAALGALALGLLSYVKVLLVFPVLICLGLAYFGEGGPRARLTGFLRLYWPAALVSVALGVSFLSFYVTHVPQLAATTGDAVAGALAETMVGKSLSTGLLGGPWHWNESNPPMGTADPPDWTVHLAWVAIAFAAAYAALRRERTGRAWAIVAGYTFAAYLLLLFTRAQIVGGAAGLEYRYLADTVCAVTLCAGLVTMPLIGARESSAERPEPLLTLRFSPLIGPALVIALTMSGLSSAYGYVQVWHGQNPGEDYVKAVRAGLAGKGPVDLADQLVPESVVPGYLHPMNRTEHLVPLVVGEARFPAVTHRLVVLDDSGSPRRALIQTAVESKTGPVDDCGWKVQRGPTNIPLERPAMDAVWWVRIGYLAGAEDIMTVQLGETALKVPVLKGLQSVFLRVENAMTEIEISGLRVGTTLCIDTIEVGQPVPGAAL